MVALPDLDNMVISMEDWSTHVKDLNPNEDHYYSYYSACDMGLGGVWIIREQGINPILWIVDFYNAIPDQVVYEENPQGFLTNSDLEIAALLIQ